MSTFRFLFVMAFALTLAACGGRSTGADSSRGDTLRFEHATLLSVVKHDGYADVKIANPWRRGRVLQHLVLVPHGADVPSAAAHATVVRVPLRRVIPFSSVHAALMVDLGAGDAIVGIADLEYVKHPSLRQMCADGRATDVGGSLNPNLECIIEAAPDALLCSPFENSGGYGKAEEAGVPIIECADYMETSPLGRAEWMRFYGILLGKERQADSLFALVDSSYSALKALAAKAATRPKVLVDKLTGSVWYVPGGNSTIGTMLSDAGASYTLGGDVAGSLPLALETVLDKAADSDVWLLRYTSDHILTAAELRAEHSAYSRIRALDEHRCYACNVGQVPFFEQTPFRPDMLLADFIAILHPELPLADTLRYYHPLAGR